MRYPVILTPDSGGYVVSFPDVPEALTQGETKEEALAMALDALITAFEFYFDDQEPVPLPTKVQKGADYVDVPASLSAKVLLLNEMLATKTTPAELARRLGTRPQDVNRIVNLHHTTKIDTIAEAMRLLGKTMDVVAY